MRKLLLLAAACLYAGQASATTYSTTCNGCDLTGMYDAAARATAKGTVYVFDATDGEARKFSVDTEIISLKPYWAFTWGDEVTIESDIKSGFKQVITRQQDIDPYEPIVLPPDFPISSVAGALLDPGAATVRIVDHVRSLQGYDALEMSLTTLVASLLKRNIPFLNASDFLQTNKLIIEFSDGSTGEMELYFSFNVTAGFANLELRALKNARLADGTPVPTTRYGFSDFSVSGPSQSLREWMLWASNFGIPVSGTSSGDGTTMVCRVEGSTVYCWVRKKY